MLARIAKQTLVFCTESGETIGCRLGVHMFRSVYLASGAALAALITYSPAVAQSPAQPTSAVKDAIAFGARESARQMDLSPSGQRVVFVGPGPGAATVAYVADLVSGTSKPILAAPGNPERLSWCNWVSDQRLICNYAANLNQEGTLLGFSRLIALDADGSNIKQIGSRNAYQVDGGVLDWLPGDGNAVLMVRSGGVERVDVTTLKSSPVEPARATRAYYMTDGRGTVRLMGIAETKVDGQYTTGRYKYLYRQAGSRDWKALAGYSDEDFEPLAIDAASDSLYALRKKDGRYQLSKIKLDTSLAAEVIGSNAKVDIDGVVRFGDGERVIGYTFAEDKRQTVYFDPQFRALAASLSKALPRLPLINFVSSSSNGQKILLFASSDDDPGRYFLYDKGTKSLGEVLVDRPQLAGRSLASVKSINYKSADGTLIPAYLTLPPGKAPKGLPAVVLPHGGPSSRDEWGFDWLSQFLAAQGYAVIQPNYRGSSGFGDKWLNENGFKGWRTSIGDVASAARWLASEGIADPSRVAIVGWSYGGYAALQSAATNPDLFKAVVAVAPVTDLGLVKAESEGFVNKRETKDFIGSGPHLVEGSPVRVASQIGAPVLLVHGDLDTNVGIRHSEKMEAALSRAGKPVEFVRYKGLDHQLSDGEVRAQMLSKIASLLGRTIGK